MEYWNCDQALVAGAAQAEGRRIVALPVGELELT